MYTKMSTRAWIFMCKPYFKKSQVSRNHKKTTLLYISAALSYTYLSFFCLFFLTASTVIIKKKKSEKKFPFQAYILFLDKSYILCIFSMYSWERKLRNDATDEAEGTFCTPDTGSPSKRLFLQLLPLMSLKKAIFYFQLMVELYVQINVFLLAWSCANYHMHTIQKSIPGAECI